MAALITLMTVTILIGVVVGAFLMISFAICREDKRRSLQFDAPSRSAEAALSSASTGRGGNRRVPYQGCPHPMGADRQLGFPNSGRGG
jgi:hypothetical protein